MAQLCTAIREINVKRIAQIYQAIVLTRRRIKATLLYLTALAIFGMVGSLQLGLLVRFFDTLQAALAIFGMVGGPQLGLFMLGMLYPCANNKVLCEFNCGISKQYFSEFYRTSVAQINEI